MKKTLYLMRHGQTLFNVEHKIQGWCDSPLTEQGIKQAPKLLHAISITTRLPLITAMQVQVNVHVIRLKLSLTINIHIQESKA